MGAELGAGGESPERPTFFPALLTGGLRNGRLGDWGVAATGLPSV